MPIFEYICTLCDAQFEELVRSGQDAQEVRCPTCDGGQTRRLLSAFALGSSGSEVGDGASSSGRSCATCTASSCAGCR